MAEIGLGNKYTVRKTDTGELVDECFVLRPDRDLDARVALLAYAVATDNKTLAADIRAWVGIVPPMTRQQVLEYCEARRPVYVKHLRCWALPTLGTAGLVELRFSSGAWMLAQLSANGELMEYNEGTDRYRLFPIYPVEVAD